MEKNWIDLLDKMEQFLYENIELSISANKTNNLIPYLLDTEEIVAILKKLKLLKEEQNGFSEEQLNRLNKLKEHLLDFGNDNKNIGKSIYFEIKRIYNNIEEY